VTFRPDQKEWKEAVHPAPSRNAGWGVPMPTRRSCWKSLKMGEDGRHAYQINQNLPQLANPSTRPWVRIDIGVNDIRRTSRNRAVAPVRPVLPSTESEEHLVRK
jgi:hypothetical protein